MTKDTNMPPFMEEGINSFKRFKLPGFDMNLLLASYEKNMELLTEAQKIATDAAKELVEQQMKFASEVLEQCANKCTDNGIAQSSWQDKASMQAEASKSAIAKAMAHGQKINSIVLSSNEKMFEAFKKRFNEGVEESMTMAKKAEKENAK